MSHEDDASKHAKQRMKERFNIDLTKEVEADIVNRIKSHLPKPIWEMKAKNRTVYRMVVENRLVDVVWDWRGGCVVTCLPPSNWHVKEK